MSYMDHNAAFTGGIQELSFEEVTEVDGGLLPVVIFAAGVLFGAAVAAGIDYLNGGFND